MFGKRAFGTTLTHPRRFSPRISVTSERTRKLTSVLLAALFAFGVGTEAHGWHDCPHHHPQDGPPASAEAPPIHPVAADSGESAASPPGSCTCVGSCHAGATVPLPAVSGPTLAAEDGPIPPSPPDASALLPRLPDPYLLPFANAPPFPGLRAEEA